MNKRVRGYAANPVIIGAVCIAVGVAIGVGGTLYFMSRHQGGLGDGEDIALQSEDAAVTGPVSDATEIVTEETTESPSTEPMTENLSYIRVTVSGNDYLYKNEPYNLDGFLGIVRANPELPVRISDDHASLRAYDALIAALRELGTEYAETNK